MLTHSVTTERRDVVDTSLTLKERHEKLKNSPSSLRNPNAEPHILRGSKNLELPDKMEASFTELTVKFNQLCTKFPTAIQALQRSSTEVNDVLLSHSDRLDSLDAQVQVMKQASCGFADNCSTSVISQVCTKIVHQELERFSQEIRLVIQDQFALFLSSQNKGIPEQLQSSLLQIQEIKKDYSRLFTHLTESYDAISQILSLTDKNSNRVNNSSDAVNGSRISVLANEVSNLQLRMNEFENFHLNSNDHIISLLAEVSRMNCKVNQEPGNDVTFEQQVKIPNVNVDAQARNGETRSEILMENSIRELKAEFLNIRNRLNSNVAQSELDDYMVVPNCTPVSTDASDKVEFSEHIATSASSKLNINNSSEPKESDESYCIQESRDTNSGRNSPDTTYFTSRNHISSEDSSCSPNSFSQVSLMIPSHLPTPRILGSPDICGNYIQSSVNCIEGPQDASKNHLDIVRLDKGWSPRKMFGKHRTLEIRKTARGSLPSKYENDDRIEEFKAKTNQSPKTANPTEGVNAGSGTSARKKRHWRSKNQHVVVESPTPPFNALRGMDESMNGKHVMLNSQDKVYNHY